MKFNSFDPAILRFRLLKVKYQYFYCFKNIYMFVATFCIMTSAMGYLLGGRVDYGFIVMVSIMVN